MNLGWERKVGYSFLGLMIGNAASVLMLLLAGALQNLGMFAAIGKFSWLHAGGSVALSIAILIVSMLGWAVVGLPLLLLLGAELVADLYLITLALTGSVLGMLAMFLLSVAFDHQVLDTAVFRSSQGLGFFYDAALIGGVAFAVYGGLIRAALRRQAKENGAPKGTPKSLAWFDF
ncbi:hypothetical protein HNQ77_004189 [Silvibacterium bohemicum]|uniref:Uncharacterized protein n=1 Tax=Silvibacterium bohemicum TaxID=1577686 RepID=A0A841K0U6_9BACT|nr:hypothetical protein [Silvibacterium bohemicum]MBB6146217.1 hypothetical protein [Silvibacterium bohemicum]